MATKVFCPTCATPTSPGSRNCDSCGQPIPEIKQKISEPEIVPSGLKEKAKLLALGGRAKSPGLAAVLGFVPFLGALYVGKYRWALALGLAELPISSMSVLTLGFPRVLYGLIGVYVCHRWAVNFNMSAMEKIIGADRGHSE